MLFAEIVVFLIIFWIIVWFRCELILLFSPVLGSMRNSPPPCSLDLNPRIMPPLSVGIDCGVILGGGESTVS
jgi:hypothetical protein